MFKKYSPGLCKQNYDAIIIGSGLGGLTTAVLLAQSGKKVLVLERHYVPGGFTHSFKREGYEWDVGVHYVGKMNDAETPLRKAFDYITEGKLKWGMMDAVYDKAIIAGKEFRFVVGEENQLNQFIEYFPKEEKAIRIYFDKIKKFASGTAMFFGEKSMPPFLSNFLGYFLRKKFNSYSDKTTYDFLRSITGNEELISVLCAQCGNYGLAPKKSSFAIQAMIADHYADGGSYPLGGAKEIFNTIAEVIYKNGGEIAITAEVKEIVLKNGTAVGVEMKSGEKIFAKKIISNAGARNTFTKLLPNYNEHLVPIKNDLAKIKPSACHICLYVGLNASDKQLQLPKSNYWVYNSFDFDGDYEKHIHNMNLEPPLYYISFPSARDSQWSGTHPDKSTIQVIVACSYEWLEKWKETNWMKRGDDYLKFKTGFEEKLLKKLYEIVPQVKGYVDVCEVSTPLSTKHFSNYGNGEIYGLEHTPERFRLKWLRPQTPVKNLFLTGQDTLTVGLGGALFSGVITASVILKKNFFSRVTK